MNVLFSETKWETEKKEHENARLLKFSEVGKEAIILPVVNSKADMTKRKDVEADRPSPALPPLQCPPRHKTSWS
jgi:hypothetical protein